MGNLKRDVENFVTLSFFTFRNDIVAREEMNVFVYIYPKKDSFVSRNFVAFSFSTMIQKVPLHLLQ